jgi:hypothetical protein
VWRSHKKRPVPTVSSFEVSSQVTGQSMRNFRLSRPTVMSEYELGQRGNVFHKCGPFMARWRSIAEEKLTRGFSFVS